MPLGLPLLIAALIGRGASTNRHVRGRLLASAVMFGSGAVIEVGARYLDLTPGVRDAAERFVALLLAFGGINAIVALAVNPWRNDRPPDRFPTIVQDATVIVLFAVVATAVLQERVLAATAVSAVVLGLALQDTLGNLFAGLAIQIEKPFRVGHWIRVANTDGMVHEVTWRATKIRSKAGNLLIVPNSALAKDTIVNYSEPTLETRLEFELGVSYDVPPNRVKQTILAAIADEPAIVRRVGPEVLVVDFGESAIIYRVRFWMTDYSQDDHLLDRVRIAIFYAFRRTGVEIPFPIRTVIMKKPAVDTTSADARERLLRGVPMFAALSEEERGAIALTAKRSLYAAREAIVRQGEPGTSMFVLETGEVAVLLEPGDQEVARITSGGYFGEMSLLTGAPRTATVRAATDSHVLEITADAFRQFVLAHPAAVDVVAEAVASRQAQLEQRKSEGTAAEPQEAPQSLVDRIRRFLGLAFG